ncbi:glycosyl hydrolase family 31 [Schaalia sp. 19OD2882]|uniref:glycoside hydrolase family 31 protein n=1 Tax=Schaalia sp. 19OD2882 TaxID=2794089 RepID=UPI001C1EF431|nr:TIM-barrel domain-containing protein [Schaalia sp. 19OD2882]QWW20485.1 glycosyl hydrolase family 31 [Schaalia sp. 19OD2882]
MSLPEHFRPRPAGLPQAHMVLSGPTWRVQVLTERLMRIEWSPSGRFVDGPTQMVVDRGFPAPAGVVVERAGAGAQVRTRHMTLDYDGQEFSSRGLVATVLRSAGWEGMWRWGEHTDSEWIHLRNLRGTARTLDNVDGRVALDDGIMDGRGITALEDPTMILTQDGWLEAREEGAKDVYVFAHGHDFRGAMADFYRLTGAQPVLPRHALGNWWSRFHRYTQEEYLQVLEAFKARNVPLSVAVIDMDWHITDVPEGQGSGWTGFTWNRELFPDPAALADEIHARGLALSLNLHPADGIRPFEDAHERVSRRLGLDPAQGRPVPFDAADPEFLQVYLEEVLHPLEDRGVDFWWIDWQQGTHTRLPGLDPLWVLNHLHVLDNAHRRGGRGLTLSRYAGPGSHRYPVGFSGDTIITWDSLDFQAEFTATASNIGYGWWSHDIGGHMGGTRDGELSTRWVQLGVFSPILRLHSTTNPFTAKEPWRFGEREQHVQEDFLRLRHRLVPYLHSEQLWGHESLQPLVQPMYWEDPTHHQAWEVPNQFMFGRLLTVAPVTTPASSVTDMARMDAWLPEGCWTDLLTGLSYEGGRRIAFQRPLEEVPVLARAGAVLPLAGIASPSQALHRGECGRLSVDLPEAVEVVVVAGADGHYILVEDDGGEGGAQVRTRITWSEAERELTIHEPEGQAELIPAGRRWAVRVLGVRGPEPLSPCAAESAVGDASVQARWEASTGALCAMIPPSMVGAPVRIETDSALPEAASIPGRVRRMLERARADVGRKEEVLHLVSRQSPLVALGQIVCSDIPEDLRIALVEILTATPTPSA